jgi:hypothetical protein
LQNQKRVKLTPSGLTRQIVLECSLLPQYKGDSFIFPFDAVEELFLL